MEAFTTLTSQVVPLDRSNVDTDAIIPKQFLKSIERTGFGQHLFDSWRYLDHGEPGQDCTHRPRNPDFVLNQSRYLGGKILLTRANFGCGSSREHATWALTDYGFRVIIAASFADIFHANCLGSAILPIVQAPDVIERLFRAVYNRVGYRLSVDLPAETLATPDGDTLPFSIDPYGKHRLLNGLDEIGLTLERAADIRAYEARRRTEAPWLFTYRKNEDSGKPVPAPRSTPFDPGAKR